MWLLKAWDRAVLVVGLACMAGGVHGSLPRTDPAINYLPPDRGAEWIVFPTAVDARAHDGPTLDATFRREFIFSSKPAAARLHLCAMRRAEVRVNGGSIQLPQNRSWKDVSEVDIADQLQRGAN